MTAIYQPVSVFHRDAAAAAAGNNPGRSAGAELPVLLTGSLEADPAGGALLIARFAGLGHDVQVTQVVLVTTGGGVLATDPDFLVATNGDTSWTITTNAGVTTRVSNTSACILDRTPSRAGTVLVTEPQASLVLDGAALASWSAPPTGYQARVWVRPRNAFAPSVAQHGAFRDPLTTTPTAWLTDQLLQLSTRAGAAFQVQASPNGALPLPSSSANSPNYALDCVYASTGPLGAVWFDSSDVGVSTPTRTLIPSALLNNSVEAFQRYPSAFYRRSTFARGVAAAGPQLGARGEGDNIQTADGVPTLYVTDADVLASDWLFQLDGVAVPVTLQHDVTLGFAGLRRPMDIWNRVIIGAIARNQPLASIDGTDVTALLGRLEWLEAARFQGGYRDVGLTTRAYVPLGQTGMPPAP